METEFSEEKYEEMIGKLFMRFPSFQKNGAAAYKPGIAAMELMDSIMGHPHGNYHVVHVAGTNGKGSVSNMLASALASCGMKVGLYTSPHILDFRERMRVVEISPRASLGRDDGTVIQSEPERRVEESPYRCVSKRYVWDFMQQWQDTFDHLDLSFFEITTIMALQWFADEKTDVVVLETGLGGRLDSTNIVTPILSVITNIGLDHCDMLGDTLPEIAFEKAGIIKPRIPVVIGESHPETDSIFERKVLYTNLPEPSFAGGRNAVMSLLTFADKIEPPMWSEHEAILAQMDLQGKYQRKNLRTVLAALSILDKVFSNTGDFPAFSVEKCAKCIREAIIHTARRTGFRGRWERLSDSPLTICDIGHNEHGLRHNLAQLAEMKAADVCSDLIMIYGSVADKDVDAVLHLMPEDAIYIFTQAQSSRALPADSIRGRFISIHGDGCDISTAVTVQEAVRMAYDMAHILSDTGRRPMIYIGGSTYVVSEVLAAFNLLR